MSLPTPRPETHGSNNLPMVLFVCTGNICRSPYMELYFRSLLKALDLTAIDVTSAGTSHVPRHRIAGPMAEILAEAGIESKDFRAKALTAPLIDQATLIITAEISHRAAVVRLQPRSHSKVFTLVQSARLLAHQADGNYPRSGLSALESITQAMAGSRGVAGPSREDEDGIPDPWQHPFADYQLAASIMSEPLRQLAVEISALHQRG